MFMRFIYMYPILEVLAYGIFIAIFGFPAALLYGLGSFLLGLSILRGKGLTVLTQQMRSGNMVNFQAFNLSMFAGVLLVIPGFITNTIGLLLLIPALIQIFSNSGKTNYTHSQTNSDAQGEIHEGNVVDGEYKVVDEDSKGT